jgi:hypothetical protein
MFNGSGVRGSRFKIKLLSSMVTIALDSSVELTSGPISRRSGNSNMICFSRTSRGAGLAVAKDGDGR